MGWATDSAIEAFKASLDWKRLWLPYIAIGILSFAVSITTMIITMGMPPFLPPLIGAMPFGIAIYLLVMAFYGTFITGISLNIAFDYFKKGRFSFHAAIKKTAPRFLTLLGLSILIGILFLVLVAIIVSSFPIAFSMSYSSPQGIIISMLMAIALMIAFTIVILLAMPFLFILAPVALFEKRGVFASFGRVIELGKESYLQNLGFVLMFILLEFVAYIAFMIVMLIFMLLAFVLIGIPLLIISVVAFIGWAQAYQSLALAKFYQAKISTRKRR